MMHKIKWLLPVILISISISSTIAQQCLSVVTEALEKAGEHCASTGRNEACYGYNQVTALPGFDPESFEFDEEGDITALEQIGVMELSAFDEDDGNWGVVIARLQAQLPDSLPGQNITVIFFGSVGFENQGVDESGVQAFRFESGIQSARCLGLPPDGIIIDTPDEAAILTLSANGVEISLGSSAFLQTVGDGDERQLRVGMFEGRGFITAEGETTRIADGEQTLVPLDLEMTAAGPPGPAEPFDSGSLSIMYAYAQGLEFDDMGDSGETGSPEVAPTDEIILTPIPCTISTTQEFSAGLRVGPGENRTRRAWLGAFRVVTVTGISDDGEWWQVNKFEAFPDGANSVNELWVRVDEVTASGDCDAVRLASAPPIVAPPQTRATEVPGSGPSPTPGQGGESGQTPIISYWADQTTIQPGSCTSINWHIEYVSAMYLFANSLGTVPLAGITGSYEVCPTVTTTYYLQIVYTDGTSENFAIPITVSSGGQLVIPGNIIILATPTP